MIRAVVRSVLVVCLLAGVGTAGTPAARPATTSVHKAKKHHHKKKARKSHRRHRRHHRAKAKLPSATPSPAPAH